MQALRGGLARGQRHPSYAKLSVRCRDQVIAHCGSALQPSDGFEFRLRPLSRPWTHRVRPAFSGIGQIGKPTVRSAIYAPATRKYRSVNTPLQCRRLVQHLAVHGAVRHMHILHGFRASLWRRFLRCYPCVDVQGGERRIIEAQRPANAEAAWQRGAVSFAGKFGLQAAW